MSIWEVEQQQEIEKHISASRQSREQISAQIVSAFNRGMA
ncbi:hypothetical protein CPter291_2141 [Collimonas pratensis]|uniref:Uncharacterized protein n=2 Tax=Collimonas pratensis TaxID=279113 RepID=A0ABM5Z5H6_9BURK|nr:hypothetical protein CPter291_2141 [Collimonas pratensis]